MRNSSRVEAVSPIRSERCFQLLVVRCNVPCIFQARKRCAYVVSSGRNLIAGAGARVCRMCASSPSGLRHPPASVLPTRYYCFSFPLTNQKLTSQSIMLFRVFDRCQPLNAGIGSRLAAAPPVFLLAAFKLGCLILLLALSNLRGVHTTLTTKMSSHYLLKCCLAGVETLSGTYAVTVFKK